ncbi:MAG: CBS domain-containing protein [Anaerolineales bacterium]|nr:CBS domain-containing protein [Anaerolineales bacterium]
MHLILTHEQADFDAIASLLAARLLEPEALAVLPRRLNRNVRAYLMLYGEGLPFIEFRDLARKRVEQLTLVDTQSPVSVKGVSRRTSVHVVDHHPADQDLERSWTTHIEEVGATTTLLVEAIQESGVELDLITATLLLLGVYEDTGSLSYPGTTPRDIRAAAWLLDNGASLDIGIDFLNHPLSPEQHELFNQLFEAAETFEFHGVSVVIACGTAEGLVDEISTLAHKLRDIFDPDGLIILVALDGNIQFVGRSSTSLLDIGQVAEHFGGGGHAQAAAALIRDENLEDVCRELHDLLPRVVEPAVTVGEIMSRGPQILDPNQRIKQAAERMQRFGHEGYPVVDEGDVLGLLTRRAVDRAMSHGMEDRPVSTIMEAGGLVVHPSDSIQHLQRVMIQYGWGQVPVVEPDSGEIIGIVTRTDLLKTLGADVQEPSVVSLAHRLENALPAGRLSLMKSIAQEAMAHNAALYIVGGFVRDLLLGAPSVDFDLVVEGDAIGLARRLSEKFGGRVSSHRRFGTAKWHLDLEDRRLLEGLDVSAMGMDDIPSVLDFVSARTEFYSHPTALPSVERSSIKLDLHRRDFTINTLALRLDGRYYGQLLDHWGGGRDLREHQIRVLHSLSFVDDPTRMLRAVRLEQRLGFEVESRTLELLGQALPLLGRVSGERIRSEFIQIFDEERLSAIMGRLQELGLLSAIHPSLVWDKWLEDKFHQVKAFQPPEEWQLQEPPSREFVLYALLFMRIPLEEVKGICQRLHFPAGMTAEILDAAALKIKLPDLVERVPASELVARLEECRETSAVAAWYALDAQKKAREVIEQYLSTWRFVAPNTDGDTLRTIGLPPGPAYSRILWSLRAAWIDEDIKSVDEEQALLLQLVEEMQANG